MFEPNDDPLTTFVGLLEPAPFLRVVTFGSIWLLDDATYTRMAKTEAPDSNRSHESIEGRLDDFVRHPYRSAWLGRDAFGDIRLRIHPTVGPSDGVGLISSPVTAITHGH